MSDERPAVTGFERAVELALDDDTRGNAEPEPVDVHANQAEVEWAFELRSDTLLSPVARRALGIEWA